MEFTCRGCDAQLTTKDVASQTMAVPSCYKVARVDGTEDVLHAGPFERNFQTGAVQTRPMIMPNVYRRDDH